MVTFCTKCGMSLPLADVTIKDGEEYTSPDYECPECGDLAADAPEQKTKPDPVADLGEDQELTIKDGEVKPPGS